jgi:hypothetical protein
MRYNPRPTALSAATTLHAASLSAAGAASHLATALAVAASRYSLGFAYRGLGIVAQVQGEHQWAVDIFRKSLDTLTEIGARPDVARVLAEMSRSVFALGNDVEAGRGWRESLRIAVEMGRGPNPSRSPWMRF